MFRMHESCFVPAAGQIWQSDLHLWPNPPSASISAFMAISAGVKRRSRALSSPHHLSQPNSSPPMFPAPVARPPFLLPLPCPHPLHPRSPHPFIRPMEASRVSVVDHQSLVMARCSRGLWRSTQAAASGVCGEHTRCMRRTCGVYGGTCFNLWFGYAVESIDSSC